MASCRWHRPSRAITPRYAFGRNLIDDETPSLRPPRRPTTMTVNCGYIKKWWISDDMTSPLNQSGHGQIGAFGFLKGSFQRYGTYSFRPSSSLNARSRVSRLSSLECFFFFFFFFFIFFFFFFFFFSFFSLNLCSHRVAHRYDGI